MNKSRLVAASELKTHCVRVLEDVAGKRVSYVITRHGKPIARLLPVDADADSLFGALRGMVDIRGDIIEPADVVREAAE